MIEQLFVQFGGLVFQQTIGISIGMNCVPLLAVLVMMVNWFPNDITDIHDGLNTLSFTIVIVSSEQGKTCCNSLTN
jgi:hypothetical protein